MTRRATPLTTLALPMAAVLAGVLLAPVGASAEAPVQRTQEFTGTCALTLRVIHDPPLGNEPTESKARARGAGTCSGTLVTARGEERTLDERPTKIRGRGVGTLSCAGGVVEGRGRLLLGRHEIRFTFDEVREVGTATLVYAGAAGGSAAGQAVVSPDADPAETAAACAEGSLRKVVVDQQLAADALAG